MHHLVPGGWAGTALARGRGRLPELAALLVSHRGQTKAWLGWVADTPLHQALTGCSRLQ